MQGARDQHARAAQRRPAPADRRRPARHPRRRAACPAPARRSARRRSRSGPPPAADAGQRHRDHPLGPALRRLEQGRGTQRALALEIEREDRAAARRRTGRAAAGRPGSRCPGRDRPAPPPGTGGSRTRPAKPASTHSRSCGNALPQRRRSGPCGRPAFGSRRDRRCRACGTGAAPGGPRITAAGSGLALDPGVRQRAVAVAVAGAGMDDQAAHEVDDGDELERRHGRPPAQSVTVVARARGGAAMAALITGPRPRRRAPEGGAGDSGRPGGGGAAAALRALAGPGPAGARRWPRPCAAAADSGVAVTMTGELADLFPDRASRGRPAAGDARRQLARRRLRRSGPGAAASSRSPRPPGARERRSPRPTGWPRPRWWPRRVGDGLFVDLGSTTTDILVLAGGEVRAEGLTDRERLATRRAGLYRPDPHAGHGAGGRGAVRRPARGADERAVRDLGRPLSRPGHAARGGRPASRRRWRAQDGRGQRRAASPA